MSSVRKSIGAAGLLLAYSCMAFPDALGVAAAGLAVAGAANVALQVALPSRAAEMVGVSCQASVMTLGLFAKTLGAMAILFAIAAFADVKDWRLFFPAFGAVFLAAAALVWFGGGESSCPRRGAASLAGAVEVARDVPTALSALAFAVGVIADVAFNLSVPDAVHLRFAMGDAAVGTVYAVLFGVKLPVTLLGAWFFARCDARRFFPASIAIAALGVFALIMVEGFAAYLVGVALFAAGYANVYGFVYAVAAPRHPSGKAASVAALLTMSIAGGALASPLIAAMSCLGVRSAEVLSADGMWNAAKTMLCDEHVLVAASVGSRVLRDRNGRAAPRRGRNGRVTRLGYTLATI